ncbi:MAG TPA: hypothetical protein VG994_10415 [Steroidobacteraceae bacterium]|nr:hypothetical protein [Steroidobacteraceae bacterium]
MGSQSALLARRIADAARFGTRDASIETGVPQTAVPPLLMWPPLLI